MGNRVLIGMSGGVDSTAAALILSSEGYDVSGLTMELIGQQDLPEGSKSPEIAVKDARIAAEKLGIPHYVLKLKEKFRDEIVVNFCQSYLSGLTPNPCVRCNKYIKFGVMLDYALENGYDYIATGHYARIEYNKETQKYKLKKAADKSKDQSYFLYTLTQDRLRHILFPLGEYTKPQVRDAAEKRGLRNARKRDSQDICFIQNEKYSDFIRRYIENKITAGSFTDISGKILGQHTGITDYTIGQRKGLGISFESPMYVLSKNAEKNTIVLGNDKDLYTTCINAFSINFISGDYPLTPLEASAKIRYSQDEVKCLIHPVGKDEIKIEFEQPVRAAAAGQSVVFYSGEELLGGAIIK